MMLDIDNYKSINDRYGHPMGDAVLKNLAQIMVLSTRSMDTCSRYGGDEFVIILPDSSQEIAASISERIQKKIAEMQVPVSDHESFGITVSIGIAEWQPGMSVRALTEYADQAMYLSKNNGKNQVTIYKHA